jgi:hypothetical protein
MIRLAGLASGFRKKLREDDRQWQEFDYEYYKGQIQAAVEAVAAIEEEMIREFEGRAEDPMSPNQVAAQQAENQARRYIAGAEKQLEGLAKMLDRLESRGDL